MTHYPFQSQNIVDINRISGEDKHFTAKESCVSSIWSVKTNHLRRESTKKKLIIARLVKIRDILLANIEMVGA